MSILNFLFGRPLASSEDRTEKVGPGKGIGIFGLDALGSAAYGPEAALTILLPLGVTGLAFITPITIAIVVLITIVYFSYRQTIKEYPLGGGTYTVASENLGVTAGLIAGAALMIDYTLVVSVGISAGVGALVSTFPQLHPYTLPICLLILIFIAIVNLRGINDTGALFLLPAYLFVSTLFIVLGIGFWKILVHNGTQVPLTAPKINDAGNALTFWVLIKAFSSGCTAMTGIEAVSNGVSAFRKPTNKNARLTLTIIIVILVIMLLSIAYLCQTYQIMATHPGTPEYRSVLYMLTETILGRNWFGYLTILAILLVLIFQANTGFSGFPRLCSVIANHGFLPQSFANRGRRLVFSAGIYVLTTLSALLLIIFQGITDRLIPLFAIGAFVAFTFSQTGMVLHWKRKQGKYYKQHMLINGFGALVTGITAMVVIVSKFNHGAWMVLVLIPSIFLFMKSIHHHYKIAEKQLKRKKPFTMIYNQPPVAILPAEDWNNTLVKALQSAMAITTNIIVVHIKTSEVDSSLQSQWEKSVVQPLTEKGMPIPRLEVLISPYRLVIGPIVKFVLELEEKYTNRQIAVIIPNLIERKWYQRFLHNQRAILLAGTLMYKGSKRTIIINVPWYLKEEE